MFDNACGLKRHLEAQGDHFFDGCEFVVDVFHFKTKHKESDGYCGQNCNPYMFRDLLDEKGNWTFNTSIAEQTNVWFGSFLSICREMLSDRYNFFLDEMVKRRNRWMISELEKKGHCPISIPRQALGVHNIHPTQVEATARLIPLHVL